MNVLCTLAYPDDQFVGSESELQEHLDVLLRKQVLSPIPS